MKTVKATPIPETTNDKLVQYATNLSFVVSGMEASCLCPDFVQRGGSYRLGNGLKCCKHISRLYFAACNGLVGPMAAPTPPPVATPTPQEIQDLIDSLYPSKENPIAPLGYKKNWTPDEEAGLFKNF